MQHVYIILIITDGLVSLSCTVNFHHVPIPLKYAAQPLIPVRA